MELHGRNLIGGNASALGTVTFHGINAASGEKLNPAFHEATAGEIDEALRTAAQAFAEYRQLPAERIAGFMNRIAYEIVGLGHETSVSWAQDLSNPQTPKRRCRKRD
jgi:NADP-dependent aldehyde dehydrogenase